MIAILGTVVFAQELKFDGYLNSGLGLVANNKEGDDLKFKVFGTDAEQNGYRFRLNGSYTNEAKNAGVRFRLQSQANLAISNSVTVNVADKDNTDTPVTRTGTGTFNDFAGYLSLAYAYGWVSFMKQEKYDIINLSGGIIEDSTWQTGDWWLTLDSVSQYAGLGALLKITPIEGLTLGVGSYVINRLGGGSNNALANTSLGSTLDAEDVRYTAHGVYTMKDTFRVGLSFRSKNNAGGADSEQSSRLIGEFRFLKVKDLTAVVATSLDFLGEDFETKGNIILSEAFGYKIDDLNFGLNAVQFFYNRGNVDYNPGLLFNLWGSYTIKSIVPRLDLAYFMGGRSNLVHQNSTTTPAYTWHRRGFTSVPATKASEKDYSVFSVRPSVKLNLDNRTFVEIGDVINIDFCNVDGAYADSGDANKKSQLSNVVYVDLKWSF
jgi:hypothetical protein